jgi:hypothetical protein
MEKIDEKIFKNWTMDELRQWRDQEKERLPALPKDSEIYHYTEALVYKLTAILQDE